MSMTTSHQPQTVAQLWRVAHVQGNDVRVQVVDSVAEILKVTSSGKFNSVRSVAQSHTK